MKPLFAALVLAGGLLSSASVPAQQAPDPGNDQNSPPDLAAEVQQLKSEIERLSRELERVSGELERMQGEHAAEEVPPPAAQQAALTPPTSAPAPSAPAAKPPIPVRVARGKGTPVKTNPVPQANPESDERSTTTLVFQDGKKIEAQNYAIVGQTLWVYTEQDSKRFPLTDLNVEETRRANAERGVGFQLPPSR